jgi:hypothetical protein
MTEQTDWMIAVEYKIEFVRCVDGEINDMVWYDMIWYVYLLQLGSHPMAVVQYTFTHKQYTERHKKNS